MNTKLYRVEVSRTAYPTHTWVGLSDCKYGAKKYAWNWCVEHGYVSELRLNLYSFKIEE